MIIFEKNKSDAFIEFSFRKVRINKTDKVRMKKTFGPAI